MLILSFGTWQRNQLVSDALCIDALYIFHRVLGYYGIMNIKRTGLTAGWNFNGI